MIADESPPAADAVAVNTTDRQQDTDSDAQHGSGPADAAIVRFEDLGLSAPILRALHAMGFEQPTDVQVQTIPPALAGRDLLVQSRTGSGKTVAFGIPLCQRVISPKQPELQALVLAPTRELALQVTKECDRVAAGQDIRIVSIYGGAAISPQIQALDQGAQFAIGTPGRVLDLIRRGNLDPTGIRALVLDECDEMLSMGFQEEINAIVSQLPAERQTLLFSATVPPDIDRMAQRYLRDPERVLLSQDFVGVREIEHIYYLVTGGGRMEDLLRVLEYENPTAALIFCNTRDDTARVADYLASQGFAAQGISSDLSQRERERVMGIMRDGDLRYLVATDVAARGIDLPDLSHVINYTFPESVDVYVHRTGRTGRAGKSGIAVSLVSPKEIGSFHHLKVIHKIYPEERFIPSARDLATRREAELYAQLRQRFEGRNPDPQMIGLVKRILSTVDAERMLAMAVADLLDAGPTPNDQPTRAAAGSSRRSREEQTVQGRQRSRKRSRRGEERTSRGEDFERDRPTRNLRRRPRGGSDEQSFTTPDGDVELYQTRDLEHGGPAERSRSSEAAPTGMVALYLNVGRQHGVPAEDISGLLQSEGEIDANQIGPVRQHDRHSFVFVREELAKTVADKVTGKVFRDRTLRVELARPPRR